MILDEIAYYKSNKEEFMSLYNGKHLVIKGMQLIGVYDTNTQAYEETVKTHQQGSFIIERPYRLK
jgi:hypothetical protein